MFKGGTSIISFHKRFLAHYLKLIEMGNINIIHLQMDSGGEEGNAGKFPKAL